MLKPIIEAPKIEKRWQLYKGNEYMFKMLNKPRPTNNTQNNKTSEADNWNEFKLKKCFHGILQKREFQFQERLFQKKLEDTKMSKSPMGPFILCNRHIPHALSNKASYKAMEVKEINVENSNLRRRLTASKSFFAKDKCYYSVYKSHLMEMKKSLSSRVVMRNKVSSSTTSAYRTHNDNMYHSSLITRNRHSLTITGRNPTSPTDIGKGSLNEDNNTLVSSCWFDYKELNDELIRKNIQKALIYKKKRYIQDFGLANIKVIYKLNQLNVIIEPLTTFAANVFVIIIGTEKDLMILEKKFESFDKLIRAIRFEEDNLMIKKELKNFHYIAQVINQYEYKMSKLEKDMVDFT